MLSHHDKHDMAKCAAECTGCKKGKSADSTTDEFISGLPLGVWSAVVFLMPLLLSVAGAIVGSRVWDYQLGGLTGALCGFACGSLLARIACRCFMHEAIKKKI